MDVENETVIQWIYLEIDQHGLISMKSVKEGGEHLQSRGGFRCGTNHCILIGVGGQL